MKASGVIVRFLSLLDVALLLLGVLMLALMQTKIPSASAESSSDDPKTTVLGQVNFVYVYAGWKGDQNGRCYLLDESLKIKHEISTDSDADIVTILSQQSSSRRSANIVLLLFANDGWFTLWTDSKVKALEETWGVKVMPIYKVTTVP